MITKKDIIEFDNLEAELSNKKWNELMELPIEDRIRKRKAIKGVHLDEHYQEVSDDKRYILIRVTFTTNLSDFKEGEPLLLHTEGEKKGISCNLYRFEGEDNLILEVYKNGMPDLSLYYDRDLVLDTSVLDLRATVYSPFWNELKEDNDAFWKETLINNQPAPTFILKEILEKDIDPFLEKGMHVTLLPKQREAIVNSVSSEDYYLIQGPPGTGKSFVLGLIIIMELGMKHRVFVIGPNHQAINNTLEQVVKICPNFLKYVAKVGQSYNAPTFTIEKDGERKRIKNSTHWDFKWYDECISEERNVIVGLTPHSLYSSRADGARCTTLIIDEAGQMTIPRALMGMIKCKKVILAGDHKQLPPIITSDKIKDELKESIFQHLMNEDNCTMLDVSFRMCEPICNFVSDLFYDGKLKAKRVGCGDRLITAIPLYSYSNPVVMHHVDDDGLQTSDKEAAFIAETIAVFIAQKVPAEKIGVLAPFRAQVANILRHIRKLSDIAEEDKIALKVDTVDKLQGQEREIIIYSMVAGDIDYMAEMAEFLYSPNKLNVAFSRAMFKLIIVGNMDRIRQMDMTTFPHLEKMFESQYVVHV